MQPDLVGIIESVYRVEQDTSSWIGGILERLAPWVSDGLGVFGFSYSVSPAGELQPGPFAETGCSPSTREVLPFAVTQHEPAYIRRAFLSVDSVAASEIPGWRWSRGSAYARWAGVLDDWSVGG